LQRLNRLYLKASRYVVFLNAAILVLVAVFSHQILLYWMNPEFARNGQLVLAVMAMSQFVDSLTSLPSLVNDGMGHPRTSGLFALLRAGFGLTIVYFGVLHWGIDGAALGHLLASLAFTLMFIVYVHGRTVPTALRALLIKAYCPTLFGVGAIAAAALTADRLFGKSTLDFVLLLLLTMALLFVYGALFIVEKSDKTR